MTDIRDFVNRAPATPSLQSSSDFVIPFEENSPIDEFIETRTKLLTMASEEQLTAHPLLGQLAFLGMVSNFENYCRCLLAGALSICPRSQEKASEKLINFGGVMWHRDSWSINRSAFDSKSFADCKELKKCFREFACFELQDSIFKTVLEDFEKLMQFRHATVHADGVLPGRNAVKLEIVRTNNPLRLNFNSDRFQSSVQVISTLVELINRELFLELCKRWATDWRRRGDWQPSLADKILKEISALFTHAAYKSDLPNKRKWGQAALQAAVEAKFDVE